MPSSSRGNREQLDPSGLTNPLSTRLTTETEKWIKPAIMAGPKIASERRTCGQALLSTAWAGLGGQQPLALAQNRANALGLLGKEKCSSSCPYQGKGDTVGLVFTGRITKLRVQHRLTRQRLGNWTQQGPLLLQRKLYCSPCYNKALISLGTSLSSLPAPNWVLY